MTTDSPFAPATALLICVSLMVGGCTTEELYDLQRSVSNVRSLASGTPTSVSGVMYKVRAAQDLIQTAEKYRRLSMAEKQSAAAIAQRHYDALVREEMRRLKREGPPDPGSLPKATRPGESGTVGRTESTRKKETGKTQESTPTTRKKSEPAAAPEMSEDDWYKLAQKNVESNYSTDFAVPVKNPEGKSVVAFASVKNGKATVGEDAYVLAGDPRLSEGLEVAHNNRNYKVVGESIGN